MDAVSKVTSTIELANSQSVESKRAALVRKANTLSAMNWMIGEINGFSLRRSGLIASVVAVMTSLGGLAGLAVIFAGRWLFALLGWHQEPVVIPFGAPLELGALALLMFACGAAGVCIANRGPTKGAYVREIEEDLFSYDPLDVRGHQLLLAQVEELGAVPPAQFRKWYLRELRLVRAEMKRLPSPSVSTQVCPGEIFTQV